MSAVAPRVGGRA